MFSIFLLYFRVTFMYLDQNRWIAYISRSIYVTLFKTFMKSPYSKTLPTLVYDHQGLT